MRMSPFFVQLGRIVVGYVVAALVIIAFYALAFMAIDKSLNYKDQAVHAGIIYSYAYVIVIFILPLLIVFSEWRRWRQWLPHVGLVVGAGALMLAMGRTFPFLILTFGCAASGLTYWAIAGRHAGSWRA